MRPLSIALVAVIALSCSACSSNNEGKIVGKWKMTSAPTGGKNNNADFDSMTKLGLFLYLEFKADGAFEFGIGSDKPEMLDMIKASAPGGTITWRGKYRLKSGDTVEMYDLPKEMQSKGLFGGADKARTSITINGDNMTMKDTDGTTGSLTRMK